MEHREGQQRRHLFLYLDVIDRQDKQLLGNLGDISEGGLMIITPRAIPLNLVKYLRIKLPEDEEFPSKYLDIKVETRWKKPDVNPDLCCIGCQFLQIAEEDKELVEKLSELLTFEG